MKDPLQPFEKDLAKRLKQVQGLYEKLLELTEDQFKLVEKITLQLSQPYILLEHLVHSDLIDQGMLASLGDALRIHHCFSREPLSKDRFEYALERAAQNSDQDAELARKGNPGHDITINNQRFSLKTEASNDIKPNSIHISKFMELGKGDWDFDTQSQRYFRHMESYDRVVTFRCLSKNPTRWHYELVEIPKSLLLEAASGKLSIATKSSQNPKPFYTYIYDKDDKLKFQLYFDGGTERKLQVQKLQKSLCTVHATWIFAAEPLESQLPLDVGEPT